MSECQHTLQWSKTHYTNYFSCTYPKTLPGNLLAVATSSSAKDWKDWKVKLVWGKTMPVEVIPIDRLTRTLLKLCMLYWHVLVEKLLMNI